MREKEKNDKEKAKKTEYVITAQGSLGLMALGHRGIDAWKTEREKSVKK